MARDAKGLTSKPAGAGTSTSGIAHIASTVMDTSRELLAWVWASLQRYGCLMSSHGAILAERQGPMNGLWFAKVPQATAVTTKDSTKTQSPYKTFRPSRDGFSF